MNRDEQGAVRRKPVWAIAAMGALLSLGMGSAVRAQNVTGAPGCGPDNEHFDVKTTKSQHPEAKEDAKAVVYLLQDAREFESTPKPVVRMGVDGKWIGATHGTSYLVTTVEPGEHHL